MNFATTLACRVSFLSSPVDVKRRYGIWTPGWAKELLVNKISVISIPKGICSSAAWSYERVVRIVLVYVHTSCGVDDNGCGVDEEESVLCALYIMCVEMAQRLSSNDCSGDSSSSVCDT